MANVEAKEMSIIADGVSYLVIYATANRSNKKLVGYGTASYCPFSSFK